MRYVRVALGSGFIFWTLYAAETDVFTPAQKNFWSLRPAQQPTVPLVKNQQWVRTPIDAFVLSKLESEGIAPNPNADKLTLLRRATIDITGLPPAPAEIQEFLADNSSNAWDKVVDRLLASPAYGERWARHWLDVARYADSDGFKADETRPYIWRYRDYVIQSLNSDKPYNRFVREQIAGDELYPGDPDALIATGFNRHWTDDTNAPSLYPRRQETLDDMTNVTAAAFLGLTYGCARCHDHKFDPILHKDYYRLQAFFANTSFGDGPVPLKEPEKRRKYEEQKALWEEETKAIRSEMAVILEPLRKTRIENGVKTLEAGVKAAIFKDPAKRSPLEAMMYHMAQPRIIFDEESDARTLHGLKGDAEGRYAELKKMLARFDSIKPAPLPEGQFMIDLSATAPPTFVLKGGNLAAKLQEVQPGFLSILDPSDAKITPPAEMNSTGRRSALATWLTDLKNPLPARVMVNRIWHYHFGRGIVSTPGDFGRMGARPTHPELLDYLATYFIDNGWSIKKVHRLILLSNTYQESSVMKAKAIEADPDNDLRWRWDRRRMEAEAIRDSMLMTSGVLNRQMGGPGVFPPLPEGVNSEFSATADSGGWRAETDSAQNNRRSVYIFVRRNLRYPLLQEFDSANTFESCDLRKNTVTPAQSLDLLNSPLILEWARAFAGRVLNGTGLSAEEEIDRMFKLAYGRSASPEEQKLAAAFLAGQMPILAKRFADGKIRPLLPLSLPSEMDRVRAAAMVDLAHMLLISNEFLYIN